MKSKQFRLFSMLLALFMAFTIVFSGCGSQQSKQASDSSPNDSTDSQSKAAESEKLDIVEATYYHYGAFYNTTNPTFDSTTMEPLEILNSSN